ncbi:hypothetical protein TEA_008779 [Camellia sinensis var. sinensis]|uniref:acireductone dioxygenase (Fe(2+)-requiring) n=1 Tax=Camellia sinensis var. sinensis TaxID=542762 RepID=A0A4S4EFW2_CAMSN|nr:hypothetical protein TEA_008779 [Camellia sinensis var. sinensis]
MQTTRATIELSWMEYALGDDREEVIQAWYMDDSDEDQRLPHHREPKEFVSLEQLAELGVLSWRLDADNYETDEKLKKIREERGYSYMAMRLFIGDPIWTPFNRPHDHLPARKEYVENFVHKEAANHAVNTAAA